MCIRDRNVGESLVVVCGWSLAWGGLGLAYQYQPGNMLSWQLADVSNVCRSVHLQSISQTVGKSLVDNGLDFGWGGLGVRLNATSAFASIKENVGR